MIINIQNHFCLHFQLICLISGINSDFIAIQNTSPTHTNNELTTVWKNSVIYLQIYTMMPTKIYTNIMELTITSILLSNGKTGKTGTFVYLPVNVRHILYLFFMWSYADMKLLTKLTMTHINNPVSITFPIYMSIRFVIIQRVCTLEYNNFCLIF